jgi:hypothetical protein
VVARLAVQEKETELSHWLVAKARIASDDDGQRAAELPAVLSVC